MEIQQLRHFIAASRAGGYAQAAEACSTSRQNVAHSIKVLESECEATLFEKVGNSMALTPAGVQAMRLAERIVEKVDALTVMFSQVESDREMSVAVSTNLLDGITHHVADFFESLPDSARVFEMDCGRCHEAVVYNRVDIAILMCMERVFTDCDVFELARSRTYALVDASSTLSSRDSITVDDLVGRELVVMSDPSFQYEPLFAEFHDMGVSASSGVISGTSAALHMVKRGAIGFVSGGFASDLPEGVSAVPLADDRFDWHFYALFKLNSVNHQAVLDVCSHLKQMVAASCE